LNIKSRDSVEAVRDCRRGENKKAFGQAPANRQESGLSILTILAINIKYYLEEFFCECKHKSECAQSILL
jgi:hypothetical protein